MLNQTALSLTENGDTVSVDLLGLASNSKFQDSIYTGIYPTVSDSLIKDSAFLQALADSIDSDVDTLMLNQTALSLTENGDTVSVELLGLASNSKFQDSIYTGIYPTVSDSLIKDSAFLQALADSIDSDVDTLMLNQTALSLTENGDTVSVELLGLASNSKFQDSIYTGIYPTVSDSLIKDSAFLQALADSIDSDVDTLMLNQTALSLTENGDTVSVELLGLASNSKFQDSIYTGIYPTVSDSLIKDSTFLQALADSIDSDVDTLMLNQTALSLTENGDTVSVGVYRS